MTVNDAAAVPEHGHPWHLCSVSRQVDTKLIFSQANGFLVATIICRFLAVAIIYQPSVPDLDHSREVDVKCNVSPLALRVGQF